MSRFALLGLGESLPGILCALGGVALMTACGGDVGGPSTGLGGSPAAMPGGPEMVGGAGAPGASGAPATPSTVPQPSDWFAAIDGADCAAAPAAAERSRIRRLSTLQWANTISAALGVAPQTGSFPVDATGLTGFNTDATANKVNVLLANAYYDASAQIATGAAPAAMQEHACLASTPQDAACASTFVQDYGSRLFRRPLDQEETARFSAFLTAQAAVDPAEVAVATTLRGLILSPNTLYLTELGNSAPGNVALTPYEVASLVSYNIVDGPPDAMLLNAAAQGQLATSAQIDAQAVRLLAQPAARGKYREFWSQYFTGGELEKADDLDPALVTAMRDEPMTRFENLVWEDNGSFADLVAAPYTYGDDQLAQIYGDVQAQGDERMNLSATERAGFLTQPGFLYSAQTSTEAHKVIHRGLAVRLKLLCQPPTPPPPGLVTEPTALAPLGEDATARESWDAFAGANPACAGCHSGFQPLGLAFEAYDSEGRFRETYEDGSPILTAGTLERAGDASGPYANAVELAQRIGQSKIGEYCFSRQFAEFAMGRAMHASLDACLIRSLGEKSPNGAISQFAVAVVSSAASSPRSHY